MSANSDDNDGDDCWDAFGDEDDELDDNVDDKGNHEKDLDSRERACQQPGVLYLTQHFIRANPQIPLSQRRVALSPATTTSWRLALQNRGMKIVSPLEVCDAAILICSSNHGNPQPTEANSDHEHHSSMRRNIVPGGILLILEPQSPTTSSDTTITNAKSTCSLLDSRVWNVAEAETLYSDSTLRFWAIHKHACCINDQACRWIPSSTTAAHSLVEDELRMLRDATVTRSAHETLQSATPLTESSLQRATRALQQYGYCVIRNLLDPQQCQRWGDAVIQDFHHAAQILLERDHVDLKQALPSSTSSTDDNYNSSPSIANYRELAMREDLRMDFRDGPMLQQMRQQEDAKEWNIGSMPETTTATMTPILTTAKGSHESCLRFQSDVLEIIRRAMNPQSDLGYYKGNFGRYNFDGSGPDGSYPPLRIGPMGGIISLPGSADQALHADTPHLFEHMDCLPAHYINAFALGAAATDTSSYDEDGSATGSTSVGGTAFVHGSHRLSFTAKLAPSDGMMDEGTSMMSTTGRAEMLRHLIRPSLQLGDVILFDCRILHFGLANTSTGVERPLLYVNMTHAWFHDPKNWNDRQQIFSES